jgi:quinol monooxygenase YgiN
VHNDHARDIQGEEDPMIIVHVFVHVKQEAVEAFKGLSVENARNSIREPGIVRFDVIQQIDNPSRFVLVEIYRDDSAILDHKQTRHYLQWRDAAEDMMMETRHSIRYKNR